MKKTTRAPRMARKTKRRAHYPAHTLAPNHHDMEADSAAHGWHDLVHDQSLHRPVERLQGVQLSSVQRQAMAMEIARAHGNGHLQQIIARQQSTPAAPDPAATLQAREALVEQIANNLQGKPPKEKAQGVEAIKKVGEAALETETGKKIQKKVKGFLLSKQGLPVSIMLGTTGIAALVATNTDVPSIPIPLSDNIKLTIDLEGPLTKPTGVMATFRLDF